MWPVRAYFTNLGPLALTHLRIIPIFACHVVNSSTVYVVGSEKEDAAMADFAAAQKRILERQTVREQAFNAIESQQYDARTSQLLRLPPTLRSFAFGTLSLWENIKSPYGTEPAFRVGQVDSELLDESLIDLLKKNATEGLKLYGAHLKDDWDAEITAALRTVLWKLSLWDNGTSYGASLQGLKYIDARRKVLPGTAHKEASRWQRGAYGIISIGGRYAWSKWEDRLSSLESYHDEPSSFVRRLERATTFLNTSYNIAAFASFLVFLYNGRYRTLLDRLLRLRLVPSSNQTNRDLSFEFLNRQLVWHAFTEFLLFLLPLIGINRWRRWIDRVWKKFTTGLSRLRTGTYGQEGDEEQPKGELSFLPERTCAICYRDQNPTSGQSEQDVIASTSAGANGGIVGSAMTDITNPYEAIPCGCIYCFMCLAWKIEGEEGEGWICLRCGEAIKECRPWNGDVVDTKTRESRSSESSRPNRRKSVMFDLDVEKVSLEENEAPLETLDPSPIEQHMDEMSQWSSVDMVQDGQG